MLIKLWSIPNVAQFHNPNDEPVCDKEIHIAIDDDQKLQIDDYRTFLYNDIVAKRKEKLKKKKTSSSSKRSGKESKKSSSSSKSSSKDKKKSSKESSKKSEKKMYQHDGKKATLRIIDKKWPTLLKRNH